MAQVYIGLGSNLGCREENLARALRRLSEISDGSIKVLRHSSIYESKPWGKTEQPDFLNQVAEVETTLEPKEFLVLLKKIERELGRTQDAERWGPRVIDLDILFWGDLILNDDDLAIPHPFISDREFVLAPLSELASHLIHPVTGRTVEEMLASISERGNIRRLA
jgi:2-amino-4-hydroxy-6-hydroxymethyldihydropteridine diphosphokinase